MVAGVIELFPEPAPKCRDCGAEHNELGVLCVTCRSAQEMVPAAYLQSTIAGAIVGLRRWEAQGNPLSGPLADTFERLRLAYDIAEPRINVAPIGEILIVGEELWSYPEPGVALGPFRAKEDARTALFNYFVKKGGTMPKPSEVVIQEGGMLANAFGNTEIECAAALVVRWHHVNSPDEWRPISREQAIAFLEADTDVARKWANNPFWRPNPHRLREEGWMSGWSTVDEPGMFTEKALSALANRGEWKTTRGVKS